MSQDYLNITGQGIDNNRLTIKKLSAENEYLREVIEHLVDDLISIPQAIKEYGYIDITTFGSVKMRLVQQGAVQKEAVQKEAVHKHCDNCYHEAVCGHPFDCTHKGYPHWKIKETN